MGSTRPCAPSSRPTQSRPCTVSPSSSHSATISTLPTACPPRSPSPVKRCCTTRLQVVPHESSPHSAASAIRRSPGGRTPNSRRSRPLDPPSSATVTTAVRSRVTRRSADSEAYSPCPPPSATTLRRAGLIGLLTPKIAMRDLNARPRPRKPGCEFLGDHHAAVLPARAAERHCHEMLSASLVTIQSDLEHVHVGPDEFLRARLSQ